MWTKQELLKTFSIRKLYKEYNTKFFKGKLGDCNFDVYIQGKDEPPTCAFENAHKKRGGGYVANINFNAKIDWNQENISNTLIHEMIHYYHYTIFERSLLFPHGIPFIISQIRIFLCSGIYVLRRGGCTFQQD